MTDGAQNKTVWLAGASGTIGRAAAFALLDAGHRTVCLLRDNASGHAAAEELFGAGAQLVWDEWPYEQPDTVISCMASRSGSPRDAHEVDHLANRDLLRKAEKSGAEHFVLLSAICVQRPRLAFQHAKLKFEAELVASPIDHTIIRPTAFFKSLSGQVERVRNGKPYLLFGDGELTRCKPISDADLARFIADCVANPAKRKAILPIGGPGPAISPREQGAMLFELLGRAPKYRSVPVGMIDAAAAVLSLGARFSNWFAEKSEYARIAKYYATESMLLLDPATGDYSEDLTPEFGSETLRDHYARLLDIRP